LYENEKGKENPYKSNKIFGLHNLS